MPFRSTQRTTIQTVPFCKTSNGNVFLSSTVDNGHTVYTDRYYTSVPLAQALQERSTGFVGTAIKNRIDLPDEIRAPSFRLANDETVAFRSDRLLALGWRAAQKKKPLIMLATESCATPVSVRSKANGRTAL